MADTPRRSSPQGRPASKAPSPFFFLVLLLTLRPRKKSKAVPIKVSAKKNEGREIV